MVAAVVSLHQGLCSDQMNVGIEGVVHGEVRVANGRVTDIRSPCGTECLGPEAFGDLDFDGGLCFLNDFFGEDMAPEIVFFFEEGFERSEIVARHVLGLAFHVMGRAFRGGVFQLLQECFPGDGIGEVL